MEVMNDEEVEVEDDDGEVERVESVLIAGRRIPPSKAPRVVRRGRMVPAAPRRGSCGCSRPNRERLVPASLSDDDAPMIIVVFLERLISTPM
jgi:hypothetical protein